MYREPKEFKDIRDLLESHPGGLTPKDFADKLPLCKNTIAKYLAMMHVLGQIDERPIGTTKLYTMSRRVPIDTLLDLISDLVMVVDQDMKIIQMNERLLQFLSIKKEELPFGSLEHSNLPLLSEPYIISKIQGALSGRRYKENICVKKNDAEKKLLMQVVPTTSMQGRPAAAVVLQEI